MPDTDGFTSSTGANTRANNPRSSRIRYCAAAAAGAGVYFILLYRFLSYSERNRLPASAYMIFAAAAFLVGLLLSLGASRSRRAIATALIVGVCAMHAIVILIDWSKDPTDHNLFPFEFVILFVTASPVYAGAGLARLVDSRRGKLGPPPLPPFNG